MRPEAYLGVDVGSISTKGVLIDRAGAVLAAAYLWTEGDPAGAVARLIRALRESGGGAGPVCAAGVTGSARRLAGAMLGAVSVKNEITAHAVEALSRHPDARTIIEIGGQDSKLILTEGGVVTDYAMNTLCAAGTGAFLSSQAARLGVRVEDMGALALRAERAAPIAARCTVFAETDLVHRAQAGYKKEELIAGLCAAVAGNYLSNVAKGKKITPPVVFQGGVSKNAGVARAFEAHTGFRLHVDADSHLAGALGAALLARAAGVIRPVRLELDGEAFETRSHACKRCPNGCDVVRFYKNGALIDMWGGRCPNGELRERPQGLA